MLKHVTTPFVQLDALVQAGVDGAVIWLYRRGVARSLIFYTLGVLTTGALFFSCVGEGKYITATLCAIVGLFCTELALRMDRREEEIDLSQVQTRDRRLNGLPGLWWWKLWVVSWGIYDCATETTRLEQVFSLVFWVAVLADIYVAKSPKRPPPKHQEEELGSMAFALKGKL